MGFTGYKDFDSGSGNLISDYLKEWKDKTFGKNATATPYQTGGGSAGTGGVGRNPSGYSGTGVPTYNADGEYQITVYPSLSPVGSSYLEDYPVDRTYNTNYASWNISGLTVSGRAVGTSSDRLMMYYAYKIVKPSVSGLYYIKTNQYTATHWLDSDLKTFRSYSIAANSYSLKLSSTTASSIIKSGNVLCYVAKPGNANSSVTFYFHPIVVTVIPDKSSVKQQTNITINNNTWNGNIYQDNSTNLTYIYPQYTTINNEGDTITNISNNPIIYNNETKQYYTYDTVTNNYYYITYEAPTPSPSPDPTPTPDPGTDPTPTPKPDGSGDVSTPESGKPGSSSGGQSWWEKLLGKIGDAIVDGLLGAISAVLKLIFKLFTTILGWIIWLVSQVLTLFPFLPPGLGALLIGGVVVCFIIGLIKFIRG